MARIGCDDCGTTLLKDGVCPNCDEEVVMIANYMVELNLAEVAADKFIAFMERND